MVPIIGSDEGVSYEAESGFSRNPNVAETSLSHAHRPFSVLVVDRNRKEVEVSYPGRSK